ncbi:hypothetical protein TNCT_136161 [Trichonephila clavata]|uniref:Uncharacterized protein n=1 Tax=Trichonephila clavata TaxID=2740835 RepID=A0A8X6M1F9_TRICU|nr:hypothetical protein TNCT_136161 [Trichonephila clavata]
MGTDSQTLLNSKYSDGNVDMILLISRRSGNVVLATRLSSSFNLLKFLCSFAISSSSSFSLRKNFSIKRSSLCPELCSYTDSNFSHTLLAVLQTDVNSALLSSILPTNQLCQGVIFNESLPRFLIRRNCQLKPRPVILGIPDLHKQHHEHLDVATRVQFAASIYSNLQLPQAFQYEL